MSATQIITDRFIIKDSENDLLGRGGMGNVYRAIDTHSGEIVAIKVLNPDAVIRDSVTLERFVREGEALRKLNHPNIVKLIAAVEQGGQHYLVIEYVGSGSLKDALAIQAQLPVERVVEIALDLADALTRAHRLGIIHRDLKPSNILLTEDGTPRLTDFGIAYLAGTPHLTKPVSWWARWIISAPKSARANRQMNAPISGLSVYCYLRYWPVSSPSRAIT